MKNEERIKRYGGVVYEKWGQQTREWKAQHSEEVSSGNKEWREANPDKVKANNQEGGCKGGKYYKHVLEYQHMGLQGKRNVIRATHAHKYRPFKRIIAPDSEIHHEWVPETAKYRGVALVEKDQHQYGIIDVIKILKGKITLLTEKEIKVM